MASGFRFFRLESPNHPTCESHVILGVTIAASCEGFHTQLKEMIDFTKNTETQWAWLFDSFLCCILSCLVWCQWENTRLQKNSSQLVHVEGFGFYLHEPKKMWPQIVYVYLYVWWHIHPWLNNYRNNWKNLNYINLLFHPSLLFQGVTNLHIICLRFFLQMQRWKNHLGGRPSNWWISKPHPITMWCHRRLV